MKGGTGYDDTKRCYVAIVHTWDNVECQGKPEEWISPKIFPTESEAMKYYKTYIRASLHQMMSNMKEKSTDITISHSELE